jgi:hypothetical protein
VVAEIGSRFSAPRQAKKNKKKYPMTEKKV